MTEEKKKEGDNMERNGIFTVGEYDVREMKRKRLAENQKNFLMERRKRFLLELAAVVVEGETAVSLDEELRS